MTCLHESATRRVEVLHAQGLALITYINPDIDDAVSLSWWPSDAVKLRPRMLAAFDEQEQLTEMVFGLKLRDQKVDGLRWPARRSTYGAPSEFGYVSRGGGGETGWVSHRDARLIRNVIFTVSKLCADAVVEEMEARHG